VSVIESTLDGRYQVITKIASGGMGEVYRATDAVLAREVAIKVLHPQLAGDRGFVDRFRREARAAAVLNHPNIVGVYDWGATDTGTYFMVMEFVRGHNLRSLLTEYGRLEPGQVAEAILQVLAALDHAHGHGIVHRDVKPENILISHEGTVKVADFGLARAFADSYISQAEGTVTGTVQYLAPEQIHGEPADPRTDLYAVGVVMFELLTGRPPFAGETSLSIAYQHLSSRVPAPSTMAPTVSSALDGPVLHATEKDRAARPASARSLAEEVARANRGLAPEPRLAELAAQIPSTEFVPDERAPTVTIPRAESPRARRNRRLRLAGLVLLLAAVLGAGAWATWAYVVPHYARIPAVRGLSEDVARTKLVDAGFQVRDGKGVYSTSIDVGLIVRSEPPAGTRLRTRTTVVLVRSLGLPLLPVPDVEGKAESDAKRVLEKAGFLVRVKRETSESVPEGRVIRQSIDPGQKLEQGSVVTIVVSKGPPLVKIPNVTGQPKDDARTAMEAAGFVVESTEEYSTDVPAGDVIRTDPPVNSQAPKGSTVTMVVSKGPKTFPMPAVLGLSEKAATAELENLGLQVRIIRLPGSDKHVVVGQDPNPGTTVRQGDIVTIYVGG
jgi:eukaryotic-like serine/threonine-protein kinase